MYQVIRNHEETIPSFANGGLVWFTDLTVANPCFILPVLSACILVAAGEISSRNVNAGQRRMVRLLPVVFTAFIARFPAGLFVYWVTSNTVTLVQNHLIYRRGSGRAIPPTNANVVPAEERSYTHPPKAATRLFGPPVQWSVRTLRTLGGSRRKKRKKGKG